MAAIQQVMLASGGDTSTKLLLHMDGTNGSTTITDSSYSPKTPSSNVGGTITTATSKFGGACATSTLSAGSHIDYGAQAEFAFGTGDFTIDFWATVSSGNDFILCDWRPTGVNGAYPCLYINASLILSYYVNTANAITGPAFPGGWNHIAVVRASGSTKMYLNGTQVGSTYADANNYLVGAARPRLFANGNTNLNIFNGYIDEFRISSVARWTANFTPPTSAYT